MAGRPKNAAMSGDELRERIKALGLTYAAAAERLGLTLNGLNKQLRGDTGVSRQTVVILGFLEAEAGRPGRQTRRRRA
jgi:transcriptional regulator with XRE-family HTH domain